MVAYLLIRAGRQPKRTTWKIMEPQHMVTDKGALCISTQASAAREGAGLPLLSSKLGTSLVLPKRGLCNYTLYLSSCKTFHYYLSILSESSPVTF